MRSLEESQILYDHLPEATLEIIDGSGHMLPLEQPARLAQCLSRWLENTPG
ncbi:alpha/beta hydrolase [Erwinia tracheiphila]|uniref:Alpha/beta hydrolase n=1 Tax=Erwinia tracheiphila TaxID=65700 RepID=A0A345CWW4_9GAMM|nr:alpha/beta hydrolase [Erwinia tracheiphila]AXF77931.1 alpha/beta hydrolase [Erwinia tracheiphila]UIA83362.1 alpha/beta hydrolase [Erwinia tracheiphila]UIA88452.1 alpha/beta hydrolase [Erwinia tracheiphila]UIA91886.1 alpha/beta hydrolase [Erwinia tracheiphila]UIA96830.1 alpha/beta hydrolase [Erwinia tracheiphila]